jgi:hypothetical protein
VFSCDEASRQWVLACAHPAHVIRSTKAMADAVSLRRDDQGETNGEVVVEMLRLEEGRAESRARRTTGVMQMRARINAWRDHCRLSSDPLYAKDPRRSGGALSRSVASPNGMPGRGGRSGLPSAKIIAFDTLLAIPPG